ncbi:hypothetical protein ASPZODRAFT_149872 [Penicilliopsis zonata CBS 506.65]|uniref:Major facilitator superfamily (MFS) profile domain-containing protein n=1 Tax=Penicilliopsis zonata CBS 506.65 TaxID=1073090 RepID=A0A1L9SPA9_9EURO|nr:hypothetical protein ASPZODRAFT_149872 [Penicilliopsis zonata CBS 506.65]OJJ48894.1 hypothetical protein ASPZODRAFT_149872 [Penicilliopsis zonata CBS 506.65]
MKLSIFNDKDRAACVESAPDGTQNEPGPPPDGGLTAWLQVLGFHFIFFNSWGVTNSFGVFQQYYAQTLPQSASEISWIGSVQVFLLFFVGVLAGRATDAGYFRPVLFLGVLFQLVGVFMTSLCTTYWQIFLAQAVCMGLGNGCTFCPALSVTSSYFLRRRALAVGLGAAGAATGGLIYPVVADMLLYKHPIGYAWTLRVMGFIMLGTHIPGLLWMRSRLPPRSTGPIIEWGAFRELPWVFFTASMFFNFWGLYFAFFYLGTFARDRLGMSDSLNLIMILNAVGVPGRIIPTYIGGRITGMLNLLIPLSLAASILTYCWAAVSNVAGLYTFTVLFGIVAAALQSLFPATATMLNPNLEKAGTRLGMILSIVSIANLTGPAIEGALVQRDGGHYLDGQMFAASSIFLGAAAAVAARIAKTGLRWKVKA